MNHDKTKRLDRHASARIVRRLTKAAGIYNRISPHSLRHSFVTAALDAGVPLGDVQDAASDSDLRRSVHVVAHKSLGDALRWRLVGSNAADDATGPARSIPDPRAWTAEQVGEFLRVASEDRWAALWRLAATTGMRRGELVGLRWSDVDLAAGSLVVANNVTVSDHATSHGTPKGKRARSMNLDAGTVEALRDWKRQQNAERLAVGTYWPDDDFVFTRQDGALVHPAVVTRTFKRLRESVDCQSCGCIRCGTRGQRTHSQRVSTCKT